MLVKFREHRPVLLLQRLQSSVNIRAGKRFPKLLNLSEKVRVPFGDFPILAATGHRADCKTPSMSDV